MRGQLNIFYARWWTTNVIMRNEFLICLLDILCSQSVVQKNMTVNYKKYNWIIVSFNQIFWVEIQTHYILSLQLWAYFCLCNCGKCCFTLKKQRGHGDTWNFYLINVATLFTRTKKVTETNAWDESSLILGVG